MQSTDGISDIPVNDKSKFVNRRRFDIPYSLPLIAAFGNPLLDILTFMDESSLKSFGIQSDEQKEVTADELSTLQRATFGGMKYTAGGAAQNTLRVFQWLIGCNYCSAIFGGIGNDKEGQILKDIVHSSNVITRYKIHSNYPTGQCVAIVNGENRALVAHIGAANVFSPHDIDNPESISILHTVQIIYIEGYFVSHSFSTCMKVLQLSKELGILTCFNLSAAYICENYPAEVLEMVSQSDIVFGNVNEFNAFAKISKINDCDIKTQLLTIKERYMTFNRFVKESKSLLAHWQNLTKIFIVTQGKDNIFYFHRHSENVLEFIVPEICLSDIKDTVGAGDSFVAGFLVGLVTKQEIETSIKWGCWAARQIILQEGVNIPPYSADDMVTL